MTRSSETSRGERAAVGQSGAATTAVLLIRQAPSSRTSVMWSWKRCVGVVRVASTQATSGVRLTASMVNVTGCPPIFPASIKEM